MISERYVATDGLPAIRMTSRDASRIDALLADCPAETRLGGAELLLRELLRAEVVASDQIAPSTVVMHSVVTYCDQSSGTHTVMLVYPGERMILPNALSVLAPLGAALIGLSEGQSITFDGVDGKPRTVTVLKVHSQPAGGYRRR